VPAASMETATMGTMDRVLSLKVSPGVLKA
jgi:hypothetical protein